MHSRGRRNMHESCTLKRKYPVGPQMFQSIRMRSVRRRVAFLFHYLLAMVGSKSINRLSPIIEKSFDNPWVSRVELNVRFWPGRETKLHHL